MSAIIKSRMSLPNPVILPSFTNSNGGKAASAPTVTLPAFLILSSASPALKGSTCVSANATEPIGIYANPLASWRRLIHIVRSLKDVSRVLSRHSSDDQDQRTILARHLEAKGQLPGAFRCCCVCNCLARGTQWRVKFALDYILPLGF